MANPPEGASAARIAFPQTQEEFDHDPRVSFSKLENKYILEDDDGSEWEFTGQRWIPAIDQETLAQQQEAYRVQGVEDTDNVPPGRKRKQNNGEDAGNRSQGKKQRKEDAQKGERKNSAVYITSLPLDTTIEEIQSVFSKYGVIAEEIDSTKPRIKLYTDDTGKFKGDALVVYFRPESVQLAIQMLDDSDFRLGEDGPFGKMRVREADRSYKKQKDAPAREPGRKGDKDRKKIIQKTQKLNDKLADWSSDEEPSTLTSTSSRFDKVVILKHMFTLKELADDPAALLDIKEDVREECEKIGAVTNVVLFDAEVDGVVSVRFADAIAARECVRVMDGRHFGGLQVQARIADGSERYKKSKKDQGEGEEDRLDEFGQWLESEGKDPRIVGNTDRME